MSAPQPGWTGLDGIKHHLLAWLAQLSAEELRIVLLSDALIVMLVWVAIDQIGRAHV
jgi:hypothetical protein